jgi:putative ABC transport system permease protein
LAIRLVRWLLCKDFCEEIEGDMEEEYYWDLEHYSVRKANRRYWWNVFQLVRPNLIRNINGQKQMNTLDTLANYTKVTLRNMLRHKTYAMIKIGGFAIGIALVTLISLYVVGELRIDQRYADQSVYRVLYQSSNPERPYISVSVPPPLSGALKQDYPEVKETGRLLSFDGFGDAGGNLFRPEASKISIFEERFAYADNSLLAMLGFDMVHGTHGALMEPKSLIISEQKAQKYYGNENPVGQRVYLDDDPDKFFTVTGVFKSLKDTHLKDFDFFLTLSGQEFWKGEQTDWCCNNYSLYVELQDDLAYASFEPKLKSAHDRYYLTYAKEIEDPAADIIANYKTLKLQHLKDTYLHSRGVSDFIVMNDANTIRIFMAVAFFLLLLACVNFINLSTANSAQRAKEIGLRKAIGSFRSDIVKQFLVEAFVLTSISVVVGLCLAWLLVPLFSNVASVSIQIPWNAPQFYGLMIAFTLVISLLSGLYPALFLSGFRPIAVLNGNYTIRGKRANGLVRNGLVIFQFAISLILIVSALVVYRQVNFILTTDAGYDKDQMVMIQGFRSLGDQREAFKAEVKSLPFVENVAYSSFMPVTGTRRNGNEFWLAGRTKLDNGLAGQMWYIDDDFFATFDIELIEGRFFSNDLASDSAAVVINETMARKLGLEDPLRASLETFRKWNIVGVIRDFHFDDFRKVIKPWVAARARGGESLAV